MNVDIIRKKLVDKFIEIGECSEQVAAQFINLGLIDTITITKTKERFNSGDGFLIECTYPGISNSDTFEISLATLKTKT